MRNEQPVVIPLTYRQKAILECVRDYDCAKDEFRYICEIGKKGMTLETFKSLLRKEFNRSGLKDKYGINMLALSSNDLEKAFSIEIKAFQFNSEGARYGEFKATAQYCESGAISICASGSINASLSNSVSIDLERIVKFFRSKHVAELVSSYKKNLKYPLKYYYLFKRMSDSKKKLLELVQGFDG